MNSYPTPDGGSISEEELRNADPEFQIDVMKTWFFENYEDPAERTPYESGEGGYIWIWGGPYYAQDVLESAFNEVVSDDLIEKLADDLSGDCPEWAPATREEDYLDAIGNISEFHDTFSSTILDIEKLQKADIDSAVGNVFRSLLFVNVITALETYLSDAFRNTVEKAPYLMRRFIKSSKEFRDNKIGKLSAVDLYLGTTSIPDIEKAAGEIELKARVYMADMVWHRIKQVGALYESILKIDFPDDTIKIENAILTRHDIVHRNGKTKDGVLVLVSNEDLKHLIEEVEKFVMHIDEQLANVHIDDNADDTKDKSGKEEKGS